MKYFMVLLAVTIMTVSCSEDSNLIEDRSIELKSSISESIVFPVQSINGLSLENTAHGFAPFHFCMASCLAQFADSGNDPDTYIRLCIENCSEELLTALEENGVGSEMFGPFQLCLAECLATARDRYDGEYNEGDPEYWQQLLSHCTGVCAGELF